MMMCQLGKDYVDLSRVLSLGSRCYERFKLVLTCSLSDFHPLPIMHTETYITHT